MTTSMQSPVTLPQSNIGGKVHNYAWHWQGQVFNVQYETLGQGTPILLLPALSTVSSRSEMGGIANLLASQFQVVALDWLGFGQSQRPSLDYQPAIFQQLLEDFVKYVFNTPIIVIAAGHAAGYALGLARKHPHVVTKLVLVAPTWRGPLRMMGVSTAIANLLKDVVRTPILGQFLYALNTTPSFLKLMYRRHVYTDESKLTPEFINQKRQITQQTGARYAPAAFVTGNLDPVTTRGEFLAYFSSLAIPVLVVLAENAPPKSQAEMAALTALPGVQTVNLPGTLGMHEEYPLAVTEAIRDFLGQNEEQGTGN